MKLSRPTIGLAAVLSLGVASACIERDDSIRWHDVAKNLGKTKKTHARATSQPASAPASQPATADRQAVAVPKPPFTKGIYPCSECHEADDEVNMKRRKLTDEHEKITLEHGTRDRWCFDCHNPKNRDRLRLASGRLVTFETSYQLCGQCHGPKLRDWRAGVHGKRTGYWNGKKQYRLCVHCHYPHSPRFKPLKPKPRPRRPSEIVYAERK